MSYEIRKQEIKKQAIIFAEGSGPILEATELMGKLLTQVTEKLKEADRTKMGVMPQPFTRFMSQEGDKVTMWVGFRVREAAKVDGLKSDFLPGGEVLVTEHNGTYDKLQEAHEAILDYIEKKKLTRNGEPWELYYSDPNASEKRDEGRTVVVFPIK